MEQPNVINLPPRPVAESTTASLPHGLADTLARTEALLATPPTPERGAALRVQISALSSWGEVLDIPEFGKLAQSALFLLQTSPDQMETVARLALDGFHAVYQLVSIPPALRQSGAVPGSSAEQILKTSGLFVWQTGSVLFTLPSDWLAEIVIPQSLQIVQSEQSQCLNWQNQTLPIYHLALHTTPPAIPTLSLEPLSNTLSRSGSMLLVICQGGQGIALDVDIEALVTDPELTLLPYGTEVNVPQYCYGYTRRHDASAAVINLAFLLAPLLHQQPETLTQSWTVLKSNLPTLRTLTAPGLSSAPTVMVVDDSHTLRQMLTLSLQKAGYQVIQAQDGQNALDQLQRNTGVQLVVCDLEMPNMNGLEFLSHCRRDPHFADLPVVMLSSFNEEEHHSLAKSLGANAYFGKPYNEGEFLKALKSLMN